MLENLQTLSVHRLCTPRTEKQKVLNLHANRPNIGCIMV